MSEGFSRLPPGGVPIRAGACWRALSARDPARRLQAGLEALLGGARVDLYASGREALRVALAALARRSGRDEVLVPGYTCFSIPAAAVAAGLRVRLVDLDSRGRVDAKALAELPLERAAALVVANLFGVPEPTAPLRGCLAHAGVALVDDAAQSLGARSAEGAVGSRGDVGLLSFGRGKPLSALGGGALAWGEAPPGPEAKPPRAPRRLGALARALAYDLALAPPIFRLLADVPSLGIGQTVFDPAFPRGPLDGASLCLAAALLPALAAGNAERARRAEELGRRLTSETAFEPILAAPGQSAVYPRLGVLAPDRETRDRALELLRALGATRMYPDALCGLAPLRSHLTGSAEVPGARRFAERVLTLPTHAGLAGARAERVVRALAALP
jgi:perosamine synthetase